MGYIFGRDTNDWRIQVVEALFDSKGCHLRTDTAISPSLLRNYKPVGFLDRVQDGFFIQGIERAQIQHLHIDAILGQLLSGGQCLGDHIRIGDESHILAFPLDIRHSQRDCVLLFRNWPLHLIKSLVLKEDNRIVVSDSAFEQALEIIRRRRCHNFEPWEETVYGLDTLGVLGSSREVSSHRRANSKWHHNLAAEHVAHGSGLVNELVGGNSQPVAEHNLNHGTHACRRCADSETCKSCLRYGHVNYPFRTKFFVQPSGCSERSSVGPNIETPQHNRRIPAHFFS